MGQVTAEWLYPQVSTVYLVFVFLCAVQRDVEEYCKLFFSARQNMITNTTPWNQPRGFVRPQQTPQTQTLHRNKASTNNGINARSVALHFIVYCFCTSAADLTAHPKCPATTSPSEGKFFALACLPLANCLCPSWCLSHQIVAMNHNLVSNCSASTRQAISTQTQVTSGRHLIQCDEFAATKSDQHEHPNLLKVLSMVL